jgi:hypothetical protein
MCDWMRSEEVTLRDEVEVLRKVALAVHHAHQHNVIHRDLKPANILIDAQGEPHITDFGLAKMVGQTENVALTGAGMVVGTPAYVSPEQAQQSKTTDGRTDVYSLGVILFEMVTGRYPFQGENAMEILVKAAKNPVPSASELIQMNLTPAQKGALDDICHKALEKNPDDRYRTAAAFAADLEKWLNGEEVRVYLPTRRRAVAKKQRSRLVLAGLLVMLSVVVLIQLFSGPSVDPEAERRAAQEKARLEKEKRAAEERAKAAERELQAVKSSMLKAVDVRNPAALKPGLIAEYFSGTNFDMLLHRKIDPDLRVFWRKDAPPWPEGNVDMVSVRWRGYLRVPQKASYAFQGTGYEGMRLFVDDVEVLSNWMTRTASSEIGVAVLEEGLHAVVLELFKTNLPAGGVMVSCKRSNEPGATPLPASSFLHDPNVFKPSARKPSPEFLDRKSLPGAQEGELLKILEGASATSVVTLSGRDKGFLLWGKGTKLGDRLVMQFDAPEAGESTLVLALGRARNGGTVKIAVNGVALVEKLDLFHPQSHFLEHEYKRVSLKKGANQLEFTMVTANPRSSPLSPGDGILKMSLDYLRMR